MSDYRPILEVIEESGMAPTLPEGLEPAIKFVNPDWTTRGGFNWFQGVGWIQSPDDHFDPTTCTNGGLHVANSFYGAQSGGARPSNCLWVGVDPDEAGEWSDGKRKAPRVYVAGPIDLVGILRQHGKGADLFRADLSWAYLSGADLSGADLSGAYLSRAYLSGANLRGATGRDDWDELVERGAVR